MKANTSTIYMQDWLALHPYNRMAETDQYYIDIANDILKIINQSTTSFSLNSEVKQTISCNLAAYFEDVISQEGLWRAFITKHKELYGKFLPFYSFSSDYYEDEINLEDVAFLLWLNIQLYVGNDKEEFINPEEPSLIKLAKEIFNLLDGEFETAPENTFMTDFFSFENKDYHKFPAFANDAEWLFFQSYLLAPCNEEPINTIIGQVHKHYPKASDKDRNAIVHDAVNRLMFSDPCGPLALQINEWFSAIAGPAQPYKDYFDHFEFIDREEFYIIEKSNSHIKIRSVANGREIDVTKEAIADSSILVPWKTIITVSCAYYNNEWWFFGKFSIRKLNDDEDIRPAASDVKSIKAADPVYTIFTEASQGEPLMYFSSYEDLKEFFINGLKWEDNDDNMMPDLKAFQNFVLYANPKGMLIAPDIAEYVKDERNPMYNAEKAAEVALDLFTVQGQCPVDLLKYLENSGRLPDAQIKSELGEEHGKALLHNNWDFIARLFLESYYREE